MKHERIIHSSSELLENCSNGINIQTMKWVEWNKFTNYEICVGCNTFRSIGRKQLGKINL